MSSEPGATARPSALTLPLPAVEAPSIRSRSWWPTSSPVTLESLAALTDSPYPVAKSDAPAILLGTLEGSRRTGRAVVSRSAVVLDADAAAPDLPDAVAALGCASLLWETASSTPDAPRYRVVLPLAEPVEPAVAEAAARALMAALPPMSQWDPTCAEPSRAVYLPTDPDGLPVGRYLNDGPALDAGAWAPRDPERAGDGDPAGSAPDRGPHGRRDPRELPGAPGAFNRIYSMADAVERWYLPYEPTEDPHMWKLVGTAGTGGMHEISPGLWYDHHATSPIHGLSLSLWDVVCEWVWGERDSDADRLRPPMDRPSRIAALEMIGSEPEVQREMARAAMAGGPAQARPDVAPPPTAVALPPSPVAGATTGTPDPVPAPGATTGTPDPARAPSVATPDGSWAEDLPREPKSGQLRDCEATWTLLVTHDPVLRSLCTSDLAGPGWSASPPWDPDRCDRPGATSGGVAPIGNGDSVELGWYLERAYGAKPLTQTKAQALLDAAVARHRVDPLSEYLEGLEWDGVPRIDTCLTGAEDDEWTHTVVRRSLIQAVARALDPGCKADSVLVLVGPEGTGKTSWASWLGGEWAKELGPIGAKDTVARAHRSWISVADEGFRASGRQADELKAWVTQREDTWRAPYARYPATAKRRFVLWATTNDDEMLSAEDGNRRYWPVRVVRRMDRSEWTEELRGQLWAEAVSAYRAGERWWMDTPELEMLQREAAESHVQEDISTGRVAGYLEREYPVNWLYMSDADRESWLRAADAGLVAEDPTGLAPLTEVSVAHVYTDLGGDWRHRDRDSERAIRRYLHASPHWRRTTRKTGPSSLGRQRLWERVGD